LREKRREITGKENEERARGDGIKKQEEGKICKVD